MSTSYTRFNIEDLPSQESPSETDLLEVAVATGSGYTTKKASISDVGAEIVSELEWQTELTETTSKTITGAINEIASEVADLKDLEGSASGEIATFVDGSDNPLRALTIGIVATQSGTGDPSPTNVRPISGWTGANIYKKGFNLWDEEWELGIYDISTGEKVNNTNNIRCKNLIPINPAFNLCWYNTASNVIRFVYYDKDKQRISYNATTQTSPYVFTIPSNARYMSFYYGATTYSGGLCISYYPPTNNEYIAHDTNSETINIDWEDEAGTVYGGTLDVLTGVLTVTHANIASYNGETINEPWISSMDVYVAGTTPTTGAQVVYPLTTPVTYQLTPTEIRSLLGQNNIWADCGAITELKYTRDLNLCINDIISRIEALEGGSSNRSLSLSPVLAKSLTSELDEAEGKAEETEEETKEEAQKNER